MDHDVQVNIVGYYYRNVHFFHLYHKHLLKFVRCKLSVSWDDNCQILPFYVCLNEGALSQLVPLTTARQHPRQFYFEQPRPSVETPLQLQGHCSHRYLEESQYSCSVSTASPDTACRDSDACISSTSPRSCLTHGWGVEIPCDCYTTKFLIVS